MYVWPLYRTFDIFLANPQSGTEVQITKNDGYDAETTASPDGKRIVFASHRDDDVGIYTMNPDGTDVQKVTSRRGYSGGPFYTSDGQWIVYRAFYPRDAKEQEEFDRLLRERTLHPVNLELYRIHPDGTGEEQLTKNGKVNFAPYPLSDGRRIIFTSDLESTKHGEYSLYMLDIATKQVERVTHPPNEGEMPGFDGFPIFSPDGRHLVFISNRNRQKPHELNIFMADWRD